MEIVGGGLALIRHWRQGVAVEHLSVTADRTEEESAIVQSCNRANSPANVARIRLRKIATSRDRGAKVVMSGEPFDEHLAPECAHKIDGG